MKYFFLSAAMMMLPAALFAQNDQPTCGTRRVTSWETPEFNTARLPENFAAKSTATYFIPIIFHIVHNAGPENIQAGQVQNTLNKLNKEYANVVPYHDTDGVDIEIQFCLAIQDTNGNATTGIIYHPDEATDFVTYRADNSLPATYPVDSLIKSLYHWPTDRYLNVYIIKTMGTMTSSATMPDMHGNFMDGLMITYNTIMQAGLPHESGHYFGLYHTFGSCSNIDCLNDNDKVCDTPPDAVAEYDPQNCIVNTCTTDEDDASTNNPFRSTTLGGLGDQNDDTRNYMDLSACMSKFTQGQKERMQATLTTVRASLLSSPGCQFPTSTTSVRKNKVTIYPNPVSDHINITGAGGGIASLFNAIGQQVIKTNITSDMYVMNATSLQAGIYMLMVVNKDGNETVMRIAKQ